MPTTWRGPFCLPWPAASRRSGTRCECWRRTAPGLSERETVGGVEVVRYRYGPDAEETLAYAGTMHEQALRSWKARWRLLQFIRASRTALARECAAFKPDVLHVNWWVPGGFAFWPGNAGGRPVVLTSHGTDLFLLDRFPAARRTGRPDLPCRRPGHGHLIAAGRAGPPTRRAGRAHHRPPDAAQRGSVRARAWTGAVRRGACCSWAGSSNGRAPSSPSGRSPSSAGRAGRARLTVVGDGPERPKLEALVKELGLLGVVELTGALSARRRRRPTTARRPCS